MDIDYLFTVSQNILDALKQEHTQDAIKEILGLTEEVKEKAVKMFHIAEDAADDVIEIALIAMSTLEKVRDEAFYSRAIAKPVAIMTDMDDVTAVTVTEYMALLATG